MAAEAINRPETMNSEREALLDPETAFLASKKETGHEWELFKENVRPLKRGRKVGLLNHALKSHTDPISRLSLLEQRRKLIEAIDEYQGDDPLQPWIQCITWIQEAFPPGGDSSGLVVIYEQCVRTFWHEPRYKDDFRFLKVWLEYAENCMDAQVIYGFLEANHIGLTHASFYISYALHMESKNKIRTANEIFNRGISLDAQPIEKLKAAYKKFMFRSMGRPKPVEEDPAEDRVPPRSFGTVLTNGNPRVSDTARVKRNGLTDVTNICGRAGGTPPIAIYKDSGKDSTVSQNQPPTFKAWQSLGGRAERNKENNQIPSKWTAHKIPQRFGHRSGGGANPVPTIEIFVVEESNEDHKVEKDTTGKSSALKLRDTEDRELKKETELLRENPLRHFPLSSMPR